MFGKHDPLYTRMGLDRSVDSFGQAEPRPFIRNPHNSAPIDMLD
jgi:hypothetical protein